MSILDLLKSNDPAVANGILQMGLSLLQSKGNLGNAIGQAGLAGLQGAQQFQQTAVQRQMQAAQLEEVKRRQLQAKREDEFRQGLPAPQMQAAQTALTGGGGPTVANAGRMPAVDPMAQLLHGAMQSGSIGVGDYINSVKPKAPEYKTVGDSLVQVGPKGVTEAYRAPEKEPEQLRTLGIIYGKGSPQYQKAAEALATKMTTHQPATQVSVNTGQKGFDNTLKLRGDFRSEPIYKAHQEVQSAHSQITQSLKQATPAGDLAGATKIMKILDPGSVVRESELGMAMSAKGLVDTVQNYAKMVISGQKLTPTQRKEFQQLADVLLAESDKAYNAKRSEYQGIAERNGLNVPDVLGPSSGNVVDFGSLK